MIKGILAKGGFVALTGAGISEESGVPTFRGEDGIWERYRPELYANIPGLLFLLLTKPAKVADFIIEFYTTIIEARPNLAHLVLARLEKKGILDTVITQNVDNLHQEAGSKSVIELHGNVYRFKCTKCEKKEQFNRKQITDILEALRKHRNSRLAIRKLFVRCGCGGRMRPDIVLFGEALPEEELRQAYKRIENCNTLFLIGTSGLVYPAAALPWHAKERGKFIVEINPEKTNFSGIVDIFLPGKAGEVLPQVVQNGFL